MKEGAVKLPCEKTFILVKKKKKKKFNVTSVLVDVVHVKYF